MIIHCQTSTVQACEWIGNLTPHLIGQVIIYPCGVTVNQFLLNEAPGVRVTKLISSFRYFPKFYYQNISRRLNIISKFGRRCHRSWGMVIRVKYAKDFRGIFANLKYP